MEEIDTPIVVNSSAVPSQIMAAVRQALVAVGGYLVGKGWLTDELAQALIPLALVVGPFIWSQIKVRSSQAKLVTVANAAPDAVAQVQ